MMIGDRLRDLREAKHLSQGDIEKRTGLHRCYVSRVENGHTIPAISTLEKLARALEVPLYQIFYEVGKPVQITAVLRTQGPEGTDDWASRGKGLRMFGKMRHALSQMAEGDRSLLLHLARQLSYGSRGA